MRVIEPKPRTSPFEFHPDKILGEMYFTQDFLKDDFCFQINFTQRAQFRTSHAFPAKSEIARRRK